MQHQKHRQLNNIFYKKVKVILLFCLIPIFLYADAHIFVFHRFGDTRYKSTNTSIKELIKEFNYFKNHGYKVIKLQKLINAVTNRKKIDDKWIVLTIDDNFQSFYQNGLKIFKEYNYPFTMFVYVQATEDRYPDYTTWNELKEISKYGSIEFHSFSHPHMTFKSDKFLRNDFARGLKLMKKRLGIVPKYFAYPYGEYDKRVRNIAKEFGFKAILNQNIGAVGKYSNIFDLNRNALVGKTHLKEDLEYKELRVKWIKPKNYPKNGILTKIMAKLYLSDIKNANYYLTDYGWHKVKVIDSLISEDINKKLHQGRNRIVISVGHKIKAKLLIKDKYELK